MTTNIMTYQRNYDKVMKLLPDTDFGFEGRYVWINGLTTNQVKILDDNKIAILEYETNF